MANKKKKYSTAFTSGSLLFKEAEVAIAGIIDNSAFIKGVENLKIANLPVNSESSKKRIKRELENRLRATGDADYIALYKMNDEVNKKLILFYAACKYYPLITDFMLDVVLNKWYNLNLEISTDDFQHFLYRKMDTHPELMIITERTRKEISEVTLRMLREVGLTKNKNLQKSDFNHHILKKIAMNGDRWFLEVILLNEKERKEIIE